MTEEPETGPLEEFETTEDIRISSDPLERVIGQDEAVRLARIAASQASSVRRWGVSSTGR